MCAQISSYWVTKKLPQIYTANHAAFRIHISKITVQICGNFWGTPYYNKQGTSAVLAGKYKKSSPTTKKKIQLFFFHVILDPFKIVLL